MTSKNFFDDEPLSKEDEIECLERALSEFGFCFPDGDFSFLESGDIVEAYSLDHIQFYRNFELLKINPFDITTVLTYRWDELYERPKVINRKIHEKISLVLDSDSCEHVPFNIPTHHLKACNEETKDYLVAEINLKFIKPVFLKKDLSKKVGFVCTQEATSIILSGGDAKAFHLL